MLSFLKYATHFIISNLTWALSKFWKLGNNVQGHSDDASQKLWVLFKGPNYVILLFSQ